MATWATRGLRGSTLEELINRTNEQYAQQGLALINKIPTPITPMRIDKDNRQITLAYFEEKSTVDYLGVVQGIPVCFDAKECCHTTFPLANIHAHQLAYMKAFETQQGVAFLLLYFQKEDVFYYMTLSELVYFWERRENGGRKSFRFDELNTSFILGTQSGILVPYLQGIQKDLELRD
ncbi:MAG: Holliday junction resolvase RecU [Lachnospiraceae bacterium]